VSEASAGIPIPCTGEKVVTVKETPPEMRLPTREGPVHVNLGYLFKGCTDGEWVAYSGSGSSFYRLPEPAMRVLLASAGLSDFPSKPSFLLTPSASWAAWLWIVMGGFFLVGALKNKAAARQAPSAQAPEGPAGGSALGESAAPSAGVGQVAPNGFSRPVRQVAVATQRHAQGPRTSFGRKG
jgi:hypothetical protein